MKLSKQEVLQQLSLIVGSENIVTDLAVLREHDSDDRA